jgi:hypothetical protein
LYTSTRLLDDSHAEQLTSVLGLSFSLCHGCSEIKLLQSFALHREQRVICDVSYVVLTPGPVLTLKTKVPSNCQFPS